MRLADSGVYGSNPQEVSVSAKARSRSQSPHDRVKQVAACIYRRADHSPLVNMRSPSFTLPNK